MMPVFLLSINWVQARTIQTEDQLTTHKLQLADEDSDLSWGLPIIIVGLTPEN